MSLIKKASSGYLANQNKKSYDEIENVAFDEMLNNKAFFSNLLEKGSSLIGQKLLISKISPIKVSSYSKNKYFEIESKPLNLSSLKIFKEAHINFTIYSNGTIDMRVRYEIFGGGTNGSEIALLSFDLSTHSTVKVVRTY